MAGQFTIEIIVDRIIHFLRLTSFSEYTKDLFRTIQESLKVFLGKSLTAGC